MDEKLTFNADTASAYDKGIRRTLPTYDGLLRLSSSALKLHTSNDANVLVMGAGGGNELVELAEQHPTWKFTACDPSKPMLEEARQKVAHRVTKERVEFVCGSAADLPPEELFDAATCLLVLHLIDCDEEKLELLKNIRKRLKPGASFVMASMSGDRKDPSFDELFALWRQSWIDRSSLTEAQVIEMEKSIRALSFIPSNKIEGMLVEAGFGRITPFFQTTFFSAWMCVAK